MHPIPAAAAAGVPGALLIPIAPPSGPAGSRLRPETLGKIPARPEGGAWQPLSDWQSGVDPDWLNHCAAAGANAGLRLGVAAGDWQYVAVDLDLEPGREAERESALAAVRVFLRDELADVALVRETVPYRAVTLLRLPANAEPGRKTVWRLADTSGTPIGKIELLAHGQQVVIGGTHASGVPIRWRVGGDPDAPADAAPPVGIVPAVTSRSVVLDLIGAVLDGLSRSHGVIVTARSADGIGDGGKNVEALAAPSAAAAVSLLDEMPNPAGTTRTDWIRVMLAVVGCIDGLRAVGGCTDGEVDAIRDAACRWAARWPGSEGFSAELEKWESDWSTRTAPLAGWQSLRAEAERLGARGLGVAEAQTDFEALPIPSAGINPHWRSMLQVGDTGKTLPNLRNSIIALRHAPEWRGAIAYDQFANQILFTAPPPWHAGLFKPRPVNDSDLICAADWLQSVGIQVKTQTATEALAAVAEKNTVHPVRDYLNSLRWDGTPRTDSWLIDFLGAEDTPFNRAVGARFLISAVARVMRPGCKVDTVLILEGRQGLRKSSALAALAGDWFIDHVPDLTEKDAKLQIQGVWIVEFAELDKLSKTDANKAKAFLSTAVDKLRKPYGRIAESFPRQSVFAGTVNPGAVGYLRDETGNRRFWPVACGVGWDERREANVSGIEASRGQLWAEAFARFQAGAPWWLDSVEFNDAHERAAGQRLAEDAWSERIREFLIGRNETSVTEILTECLRKPCERWNDGDQTRVGRVLTSIGWRRKQVRVGPGRREWRYFSGSDVIELSPVTENVKTLVT